MRAYFIAYRPACSFSDAAHVALVLPTKLIACCILKQKRCGVVVRFGIPIRRTRLCCPPATRASSSASRQCRSGKHKTNINNRSTNELMQATQSSTAQAERDASPEAWYCFFQLCISILVVSRSTWMSPTPSRLFLQPLPLRRGIVFFNFAFLYLLYSGGRGCLRLQAGSCGSSNHGRHGG